MKHRVISLVLCLSILLTAFPFFAGNAAGAAWDGSTKSEPSQVEGVYQIGSAEELAWFAEEVNRRAALEQGLVDLNAVLTADIDLGGKAWTPISATSYVVYAYAGTFDGAGHEITNLLVSATAANYGLFGVVNTATVKNVKVQGKLESNNVVGGLIGKLQTGTVENCSFSGSVSSTGKTTKGYVGGLIGTVGAKDAVIKGCANTAAVSGTFAGGIVGYNKNSASIAYCYNSGTITGSSRSGGIAGQQSSGSMRYCYNIGESTNGICGFSNASITACYYLNDEAAAPGGTASGYEKIADAASLLTALNAGEEQLFAADTASCNSGYPVLIWQASEAVGTVPVKTVQIEGEALTGAQLRAQAYGEEDAQATGVSYRWYLSEDGESFREIANAQSAGYTIPDTAEYVNTYLKVIASGEADSGAQAVIGPVAKSDTLLAREQTEQVKAAVAALQIDTAPVKEAGTLELPASIDGCSVSWESSDEQIIAADGTVNLPAKNIQTVTLTATVSLGAAQQSKSFSVDVWAKDIEPAVYLQKVSESMRWSFSALQPDAAHDSNMLVKFKEVLKAKGYEGIDITVDSTADESLVSKTGKIFYPTLPEGGSFAQGKQVQVIFKLSVGGESVLYPSSNYALLIPWNTESAQEQIHQKADALITEDAIKGDNESLESVRTDLVLPSYLEGDRYTFALVQWQSDDEAHLSISNENRQSGADALYHPYIGAVHQDAEAHALTLTAVIENPATGNSFTKQFAIHLEAMSAEQAEKTLAQMQAVLDCYRPEKLKDFSSKQTLNTEAVTDDIQLVIPKQVVSAAELAALDYGAYWDYWNYRFSVTSSDSSAVEVNAFRAYVYRPLGEDASADKQVTLHVTMSSKLNENFSVAKDIVITVKHLERAEIDKALALMDRAKSAYAQGLLGNNADTYSVIDDLHPFKQIVWNDTEDGVDFIDSAASLRAGGVLVDTLPGWETQEDWRLFRSSNRDLIANETLRLQSTPQQDSCVKIESVLSDSVFGKYYEKYRAQAGYNAEALAKFKQLYRQPVSAYMIVLGQDSLDEAFLALTQAQKQARFETAIREYKEAQDEKITVSFTLLGVGGEVKLAKSEISGFTKGCVVFDVFKKVMEDNDIAYTAKGSYISSIDGLSEFDYGKYSGWMYTVGGAYVNAPMNAQVLNGGEDIVVLYVEDFNAVNKDIATAKVDALGTFSYTGKALTPAPTVKLMGAKLTAGKDYTLEYKNNTKIGTATLVIHGIDKYYGELSVSFKIVPAAPKLKVAKLTHTTVQLSWNKVAGAGYYKVYEYNKKTGKYKGISTVKGTSAVVKKLTPGSIHYYLVRACAVDGAKEEQRSVYTAKNCVKAVILCKAPAVKASAAKRTVTLKWSKCTGAKFYRVYQYNAKTKQYSTLVKSTTKLTVKLKGQAKGTRYYLVRAFNANRAGSAYSTKNLVKVKVK